MSELQDNFQGATWGHPRREREYVVLYTSHTERTDRNNIRLMVFLCSAHIKQNRIHLSRCYICGSQSTYLIWSQGRKGLL